ncbi:DivIVA domain-containing protein [Pseudobacteroides cellulosolvens]|uniref:DivIVA domain-containing protein n=1 Tax=Pseudobacteroides cellulosolvens ATCC 35603 = DSM 2933 TaxID=398512 RepID=A0A0L6JMR0_9FIRM|nr:DivIVA domain-containing protein [Pseudobacteroides cellulosolvens]KNY26667.1 DivIVA domain-containing protein [Pseudobacteroides cellulosolvens ATCC 35603 = DSM 2933]
MNYTPNELKNISFGKSLVRGYNELEVDETFDKIIEDYSSLIHENMELKDKLNVLNEGMLHYKRIEESLQSTLLIAQQTAEEIKRNAYSKAENIYKEAELKAQKLLEGANEQVIRIRYEYEETRKKLQVYKSKAEAMLQSQMEMLKHSVELEDEIS